MAWVMKRYEVMIDISEVIWIKYDAFILIASCSHTRKKKQLYGIKHSCILKIGIISVSTKVSSIYVSRKLG